MSPPALLVDLDGTLFHIGDRSPYDADQCGLDTVNPAVRTVIDWAQGAGWAIVFASGRGFKTSHRYATEQALFWNQIDYDALYMRRPGDDRRDDVVKEEIYREQIADAYDVKLVLDDRSSVVKMWRRLGLTCFQVDDRLD